jgi:hypothetical protein
MIRYDQIKTGWWYTYPSEKYEFVNGKDDIPYMKWKIKLMFETTNQKKIAPLVSKDCAVFWQSVCLAVAALHFSPCPFHAGTWSWGWPGKEPKEPGI